jgi:hypothetical protein
MPKSRYIAQVFEVFESEELSLSTAHSFFSRQAIAIQEEEEHKIYILPDFVEVKLRNRPEKFKIRLDFCWTCQKPEYLTEMQKSLPMTLHSAGTFYAEASRWEKRHSLRSEKSIESLFEEIEKLVAEYNK